MKALELDARKAGIEVGAALSDETAGVSVLTTKPRRIGETINNSNQLAGAANFILRGLESYLQAFVSVAVRNELMALGLTAGKEPIESPMGPNLEAGRSLEEVGRQEPPAASGDRSANQEAPGKTLIAQAIESYLKDVEPPQRERKTYDEYKLVLYRFRDTCGKRYVEDLGRMIV